jgi:serine/threonine protein kinase
MIAFACHSCQKRLSVKDELAGKKGKCPACGATVSIPTVAAALSGQVRPSTGNVEEPKALPPRTAVEPEERTRAPQQQAAKESLTDAGEQTAVGAARKGETTQAWAGDVPNPALWDFLGPAEKPDEIGRLGPYRVLKVLGAGGMGVVYKAEDSQLKRPVALKAMLPVLAASESARKRFVREAQAAAAIEHDHIVHIYQVGEDRGVPYIAMPLLQGEALDERLQRENRLPVSEILRIAGETAEGLAAAHRRGLIHRDIKPANLWLEGAKGRVKILDFGLARAAADDMHLTQTGAILGTPAYMAPEQAGGQEVDHRCDLFSLGCVLYRMSTGEMPFKGRDTISTLMAVATENPRPPRELEPAIPLALSELILSLLAKDATQRPSSAEAVTAALQEIDRELVEHTVRPRAKSDEPKHSRITRQRLRAFNLSGKKPWLVGLVAGLAALVILGFVLFRPRGVVKIENNHPDPGKAAEPLLVPPIGRGDFAPLFNGEDLSGWKIHPDQPGHWRVVHGVLTGSGPAVSHLFSERGDYKNFHLRASARINDGGNSGIFFRAPFGPKFLEGFEAQINSSHQDPSKTGSLYGALGSAAVIVSESPVRSGQWFDLEIIAQGNHIEIKINGKTTAYYTDEKQRHVRGHFALQQQNPETVAEFRKIEIKELPDVPSPSPAADPKAVKAPEKWWEQLLDKKELRAALPGQRLKPWFVADGVLQNKSGGSIFTQKTYTSFDLRLEFQITPNTAASVNIWSYPGDTPIWVFLENTRFAMGAITFDAREKGFNVRRLNPQAELRPDGQWNELAIDVKNCELSTTLNGRLLDTVNIRAYMDQRRGGSPLAERFMGRIGLSKRWGSGKILIRKLSLKEL